MESKKRETLRNAIPASNLVSYFETNELPASRHFDTLVAVTYSSNGEYGYPSKRWPGQRKSVTIWWILESGYLIGFNESYSHGFGIEVVSASKAAKLGYHVLQEGDRGSALRPAH